MRKRAEVEVGSLQRGSILFVTVENGARWRMRRLRHGDQCAPELVCQLRRALDRPVSSGQSSSDHTTRPAAATPAVCPLVAREHASGNERTGLGYRTQDPRHGNPQHGPGNRGPPRGAVEFFSSPDADRDKALGRAESRATAAQDAQRTLVLRSCIDIPQETDGIIANVSAGAELTRSWK